MGYLIALVPAICWGIQPIVASKTGGSATNQVFGIGIGALIVAAIIAIIQRPTISLAAFMFSVLTGACWVIGQTGQFASMQQIGVSNALPISTGLQLLGNTLVGVLFFHEWQGARSLTIGGISLLLVIIGALLTSVSDRTAGKRVRFRDFMFLLVTTIGYVVYSAFPKMPILKNVDSQAMFLPEVLGILLGITVFQLVTEGPAVFKQKEQYTNFVVGLCWGVAGFTYIVAARMIGVTTAFIFSQMNVLIGTVGGILILHEQKDAFEMRYTIIGLCLVIAGAIETAFA